MDAVGVAKKNSRKLETTNRGTPSTAPISSQTKAVITAAPRMKGQPAGSIRIRVSGFSRTRWKRDRV